MSIIVEHMTKTFGACRALDDVSLTVHTGELLALLGPSGSGKTTLLRMIAGLDLPDNPASAHMYFHEKDVVGLPVQKRHIGFVFQHYALFRHMTVRNNIAFGLRVKPRRERPSRAEINARVDELLQLVQLRGYAARYPHELSGGQRQRVALARALAIQPKVLLLDEPFGALDAHVRKELRAWLRRLHNEIHLTSVFVTHDQEEALEVADRVVIMNNGRIEQIGTPDEVFHSPANAFVMRFLGQVNEFHGRVEGEKIRIELPSGASSNAQIFVRPHELTLDIRPSTSQTMPSIAATVTRIQSAGPRVCVEVCTADGQKLLADLSQERFATMGLTEGAQTYVRPRHITVFPPPLK